MLRDVAQHIDVRRRMLDGKTASSRPNVLDGNNVYVNAVSNGIQNAISDNFDFEWLNKMFNYEDSLPWE